MDMKELDMMGEPTANSWTSTIGDYLDCVIIYACMHVCCVCVKMELRGWMEEGVEDEEEVPLNGELVG